MRELFLLALGFVLLTSFFSAPQISHTTHSRDISDAGTAHSGLASTTLSSNKQYYYATIKAGDIFFRVALDTASSCKAVPRYPLTYQSPTFASVNNNATAYRVSYADGTVASGFLAQETVHFTNLTVANQTFGMITDSNVTMLDQTSGILGIGFPRLSSIASSTNCAIDSSVVTNTSRIGWNNVVEFAPFAAENNVSSYFQWAIPLLGISVNNTRLTPIPTYPNITGNSSLALFDVGNSGLYGPFQDVSRIFGLINGARLVDQGGQWAVPCTTVVPMTLTFGGEEYMLQPSEYLIGPAAGNPNLCLSWPRALPPSSDGIDWQIGWALLPIQNTNLPILSCDHVLTRNSYGINTKEPPMIGLYSLRNATNVTDTPATVVSVFSSISATVATTLPNFVLATPTFTTPPYGFNSSVPAPTGGIVSSGLATSTYSAILASEVFNASAIPVISPSPNLVTFVVTNAAGALVTSTSTGSMPAVTLGVPPGWNAAMHSSVPMLSIAISTGLLWALLLTLGIAPL
ncbi:aspartic peptidase domain-containing protein [Infundibulicybe gibba]|nr:aspartic peptidase domain-containing protein [Infundibulicybe gibba]